VATGVAVMFLSAVIGLAVQPFLAYWAFGRYMDWTSLRDLNDLSRALRAYQSSTDNYPATLANLVQDELPVRCREDGKTYIYFHPATATQPAILPKATAKPESQPATSQSATSQSATQTALAPGESPGGVTPGGGAGSHASE
jgi:hypothetical protein